MRLLCTILVIVLLLSVMIPVLGAGQTIAPSDSTTNESMIQITSMPSHAQVLLNNTFQGYTPLEIRNVTPGTYIVTLKLEGYPDRSGEIVVKPNAVTIVAVNMTKGLKETTGTTPAPTQAGVPILFSIMALGFFGYLVMKTR
jgi:hypothetical protein